MDEMLYRSLKHSVFSFYHLGGFLLPQKKTELQNAFIPLQLEVEFKMMEDVDSLKGL